ncbi:MAG: Holliday junction branch migration protein RuvA, partial [Gemmobacter sp.]
EAAALYTDLLVREDLLQLFGFPTLIEREWHRLLMTVQGVGAKAALAILGVLGVEGVGRAVTLGDVTAIRAAPGVGPKIAQRVVLELKAKAPALMAMGATHAAPAMEVVEAAPSPRAKPRPAPAAPPPDASRSADALSALVNLGYAQGEAAAAVAQAGGEAPEADTAALIRAALKLLQPRG